jgi:hypothetical protein
MKQILSEALINFFGVEIRNIGGTQPATLSSALDSWLQADDGIRGSWSGTGILEVSCVLHEIRKLIARHGRNKELQTLLDNQPLLKKYRIHVCRTGYGHADFKVEAHNKIAAKQKALDQAGNHLFSENDSEYSCEDVTEIK